MAVGATYDLGRFNFVRQASYLAATLPIKEKVQFRIRPSEWEAAIKGCSVFSIQEIQARRIASAIVASESQLGGSNEG